MAGKPVGQCTRLLQSQEEAKPLGIHLACHHTVNFHNLRPSASPLSSFPRRRSTVEIQNGGSRGSNH